MEKEVLELAGREVVLDPENLHFNEVTLNNYIQREAGFYDNFGASLALAEKVLQLREMAYERLYADRFIEAKENGSDKLAEARAKSDVEVLDARKEVIEARYKVKRIQNHLKAWDKNHDNAQSLGHMLRKEMDKLNSDIMLRKEYLDPRIEEVVKPFSSDSLDDLDIESLGIGKLDLHNL